MAKHSTIDITSTALTHTSPTSDHHSTITYQQLHHDTFSIELPSPRLTATNGNGSLKTPNSLASPTDRRAQSFSWDGILGSAQKAGDLSQSSADRRNSSNQNGNNNNNSNSRTDSDDGINPLKRRATDAGNDYQRRRATIAVSHFPSTYLSIHLLEDNDSL